MSPAAGTKKRQQATDQNVSQPPSGMVREDHHQSLLQSLSDLVATEYLTDMTFRCAGGQQIHAHQKVVAFISPVVRKLSNWNATGIRDVKGVAAENQRICIILNVRTWNEF